MKDAAIQIRVLHCGQGDTLLLRLDRSKWVLLDCHLPSQTAVDNFFSRLTDIGIQRLDLICLSHPDRDHYSGMIRVLEHFSTPPRSIGAFCDAGIAGKLVPPGKSAVVDIELVNLYRKVISLVKAGKLEYILAVAGSPLPAESSLWEESLIAISPSGSRVQLANLESLVTRRTCSPNDFSMVLILESGEYPESFRGLLTGDVGGAVLNQALTRYNAMRKAASDPLLFDFVKIPHHGSFRSHKGSEVPDAIRSPSESAAVVSSCSRSSRLPRREVLHAFLEKDWCVFDTGRRQNSNDRFINLLAWTEGEESKHDITVSWEAGSTVLVAPDEARIGKEDLALYPSGAIEK